jgi:hypothetical protein
MKARTLTVPLLALFLAGTYGTVKQDENEELSARVGQLEARAELVEIYLQQQAQTAKTLAVQLEAADVAGFTWGVNPNAHELVLNCLKTFAVSTQKKVPGAKPNPDDDNE